MCENCQRLSYQAFIGLSIHAKMIGRDVPLYVKIWRIMPILLQNANFHFFSLVAPQPQDLQKSSINTNRKIHYALSNAPLSNAPNMNTVRCPYT